MIKNYIFIIVLSLIFADSVLSEGETHKPEVYAKEAETYVKIGEYEKSLEILKKAQEIYPDNLDIKVSIAATYFFQKNYQNSIELIEKVLKINPNHFSALILRADNYIELGDTERARYYLREVDQKYPDNQETVKYYGKIRLILDFKEKYGKMPEFPRPKLTKNK